MTNPTSNDHFTIPVDHVSDTAYLVSAYRLLESRRPDRHFDDSIAEKLLGNKGEELLQKFSHWQLGEWMMAVRTTLIDRYLLKLIDEGLDTVVNLAAGLDTRPYRMPLPAKLNWIEADFPGMIQYKNEKLKEDRPNCQLKRVEVNLADQEERKQFFSTFKDMGRVAVLTEGLLLYLNPEDVHNLSQELLTFPNLKAWLMDISSAGSFRAMWNVMEEQMKGQGGKQVEFKFLPENGIHYFESLGWKIKEYTCYYEAGKKLNRNLPMEMDPTHLKEFDGFGFGVLTR